ncbi:MAG: DUF3606 domain-containing protein [Pyrinomonadaceae bacterium]|nr:DUF3606 domain-containing protein [Sphingobacteriaceae bacterium]
MENLINSDSLNSMRINFSQDHEVIYWATRFKVKTRELYEAAFEAGSLVSKIEEALVRLGYIKHSTI